MPRVSDSVGLRGYLEFYISNKFPGDADVTVQEPHFENHTDRKPLQNPRHVTKNFRPNDSA